MRVIVIGGVAAGASVAAKARREIKDGEIVVYENRYSIFWGHVDCHITLGTVFQILIL